MNLYLDNNPEDKNAINIITHYQSNLLKLDVLMKVNMDHLTNFGYAPSAILGNGYEQPWPWDREFNC